MKSGAVAKRDGSPTAAARPALAITSIPRSAHRFRTRAKRDQLDIWARKYPSTRSSRRSVRRTASMLSSSTSAVLAGESSDRPTSPDAPSSRLAGPHRRSARGVAETHSTAGVPSAPPALPPAEHGSDPASPHARDPAPTRRSAARLDAALPGWQHRACRCSADHCFCAGSLKAPPPCNLHPTW